MLTECCHKTVMAGARCDGCPYNNPKYCAALDVVRVARVIDDLLTGPHHSFSMDDLWHDLTVLRSAVSYYNSL